MVCEDEGEKVVVVASEVLQALARIFSFAAAGHVGHVRACLAPLVLLSHSLTSSSFLSTLRSSKASRTVERDLERHERSNCQVRISRYSFGELSSDSRHGREA